MPRLSVHSIGPGATVQDLGRPGWTTRGLSVGGAMDRLAVFELAALLGSSPENAVLELMGMGGVFGTDEDTHIALTGAEMLADIDGVPLPPNTTQILPAGARLTIGGARAGTYGYLGFAGGIDTPQVMGSRAAHLTAGIGGLLAAGDVLPVGADPDPARPPMTLPVTDRLSGGVIRIMQGPQSAFFGADTLDSFAKTTFTRSPRGNRQGVRMDHDGAPITMEAAPNIVSDVIVPGDLQMTGDGVPYVLLAESQTTGGYPRIGTVIPADLPKVAQAAPGAQIRFEWLNTAEADATYRSEAATLRDLRALCVPVLRDPHDIPDLLGYQLISGAITGGEQDAES